MLLISNGKRVCLTIKLFSFWGPIFWGVQILGGGNIFRGSTLLGVNNFANTNEKVPHLNKLGVKYKRCQEVTILYQDIIFTEPTNNYMINFLGVNNFRGQTFSGSTFLGGQTKLLGVKIVGGQTSGREQQF